ncbi:hypothetical protein [Sellimonas intestinalis]
MRSERKAEQLPSILGKAGGLETLILGALRAVDETIRFEKVKRPGINA